MSFGQTGTPLDAVPVPGASFHCSQRATHSSSHSSVPALFPSPHWIKYSIYFINYRRNHYHQTLKKEKDFSKINNYAQLKITKRDMSLWNGNCLFTSLDTLVFKDSFGSFQLRQLIVYHIKDNKDLYTVDIEGDFDDYIQNIKNNCGWVVW